MESVKDLNVINKWASSLKFLIIELLQTEDQELSGVEALVANYESEIFEINDYITDEIKYQKKVNGSLGCFYTVKTLLNAIHSKMYELKAINSLKYSRLMNIVSLCDQLIELYYDYASHYSAGEYQDEEKQMDTGLIEFF